MSEAMTMTNTYAKFALHIHACKQEVTVERLRALFDAAGLEFSAKIASMFVLSKEKYDGLLVSVNSAPSRDAAPSGGNKEEEKKEEVVEEEESEEGFEMF